MEPFGRNPVHFIDTGGTIGGVDISDSHGGKIEENPKLHTKLPRMLKQGGLGPGDYTFSVPFLLDSFHITPTHQETILNEIRCAESKRIVITHGTNTIFDTAKFLWANRKKFRGRTVVLVSSRKGPDEPETDAHAALVASYSVASIAKRGLYVMVGGKPRVVSPSFLERLKEFSNAVRGRASRRP